MPPGLRLKGFPSLHSAAGEDPAPEDGDQVDFLGNVKLTCLIHLTVSSSASLLQRTVMMMEVKRF